MDAIEAYGDIRNNPTEAELWAGRKDAAPLLIEALSAIYALEQERYRLRGLVRDCYKDLGWKRLADEIASWQK